MHKPGQLDRICRDNDDVWANAGYKIISRIGSGGQGTIFLAQQIAAERAKVAIKVWNDGTNYKAFQREVFNLRNINHPNVVRYLDCLSFPNNDYALVMEYILGKPLDEILKTKKSFEWDCTSTLSAKHIIKGLLQGLSALHSMCPPLVHRDVKPSNIMIASEAHRVLLVDFGLSKRQSSGQTLTESLQNVCGTPAYLSPEAVMGLDDLDERIDVWAAGVVLHEMLAGAPLFRAPNLFALGQQIGTYEFNPIPRAPAGVNDYLLRRMLAVDRTVRLFNALECLSALALIERRGTGSALSAAQLSQKLEMPAPAALLRCLRLLLVELPCLMRTIYLKGWQRAEGGPWTESASSGAALLAREGASAREWRAWVRAAIEQGDSSQWDLLVLGDLLLRSSVNFLSDGGDRTDFARLLECHEVIALASDAEWTGASEKGCGVGGSLGSELSACEEAAGNLLLRHIPRKASTARDAERVTAGSVIPGDTSAEDECMLRELLELDRRLLRLPAGSSHVEEGLALLEEMRRRRRAVMRTGGGLDFSKCSVEVIGEEESCEDRILPAPLAATVHHLHFPSDSCRPGFDEKTNDTQMSKSLLNREPKRNAGQPDLGLCGSNDALGRSCGDGLPAAPIVRASNASPRPTTHPEQDSDQLLLRLPRNRPAPVPLSSQNSGPLRGSQRPFPTPAAIGPAKTIIAAPLAASVGLVGIRQELVQGQSLLFGVVGLRSGSVIGERGSCIGQLRTPAGVAVDEEGRIFVADSGNHRVQVFRADGRPAANFGSEGSGFGMFRGPCGIAVDCLGRVLVVDGGNHRVQIFSKDGKYISSFGGIGNSEGQLKEPRGIAVNITALPTSEKAVEDGLIYVADWGNSRVQVFDMLGRFVRSIGDHAPGVKDEETSPAVPVNGHLKSPYGVAVAANGSVVVADTANHRIQLFSSDGCWLRSFGTFGSEPGQLKYPNAVVSDANGRIIVFDSDGQHVRCVGQKGAGAGQLSYPTGLAVDREGRIIVSDTANHRIQLF